MSTTHEVVKENLKSQLDELELLQGMYCNPGELQFQDIFILDDIQKFLSKKTSNLPPEIGLKITLDVLDLSKVEIDIHLSKNYPRTKPEIFVRASFPENSSYTQFKNDLKKHIEGLEEGEVCLFPIISWIQENIPDYITILYTKKLENLPDNSARFWIYSHHIYNKTKRKEIQSLATDYNLTGFCLPGKPGVICIEGVEKACNDFWNYIKSLTWQKIVLKKSEISSEPIEKFRFFQKFEEVVFQNANVKSTHMDMGGFFQFLEKHGCSYIFKELFGVDGKS